MRLRDETFTDQLGCPAFDQDQDSEPEGIRKKPAITNAPNGTRQILS